MADTTKTEDKKAEAAFVPNWHEAAKAGRGVRRRLMFLNYSGKRDYRAHRKGLGFYGYYDEGQLPQFDRISLALVRKDMAERDHDFRGDAAPAPFCYVTASEYQDYLDWKAGAEWHDEPEEPVLVEAEHFEPSLRSAKARKPRRRRRKYAKHAPIIVTIPVENAPGLVVRKAYELKPQPRRKVLADVLSSPIYQRRQPSRFGGVQL